jgi:hypothetical protein
MVSLSLEVRAEGMKKRTKMSIGYDYPTSPRRDRVKAGSEP